MSKLCVCFCLLIFCVRLLQDVDRNGPVFPSKVNNRCPTTMFAASCTAFYTYVYVVFCIFSENTKFIKRQFLPCLFSQKY